MKKQLIGLVVILMISACGKSNFHSAGDEAPALTAAKYAMNQLDGTNQGMLRGLYANGDLAIDFFWGSDGKNTDCREWDFVLSRGDGQYLDIRKALLYEAKDIVEQQGNNVHVFTRTYGAMDGVRMKVPPGTQINLVGSVVTCGQNLYKKISFEVTRKVGNGVLGGGQRYLDAHHLMSSTVY